MNDGQKATNKYCEEVITLVKDLFGRKNKHCTLMNQLLYEDEKRLLAECENLKQGKRSAKNMDLLRAVQWLCRSEYESYKKARNDAATELRLDAQPDGTFIAVSSKSGDGPIVFQSVTDWCKSCKKSVAI